MLIDLTEEERAAPLRELDGIIATDRYFLSPHITTLKAIRSKIRPDPVREPPPPQRLRAAAGRREKAARITYDAVVRKNPESFGEWSVRAGRVIYVVTRIQEEVRLR